MEKVLQDIWILTDSGIVLFTRVYEEKLDSQLFGALMSALNTFAQEISVGGLSNFELSNKKFTITKRENLIFVVNFDKNTKEKKVYNELKQIIDKFFELYGKYVKEFDGEVERFSNFEEMIKESLQDPIKKFEKAFW